MNKPSIDGWISVALIVAVVLLACGAASAAKTFTQPDSGTTVAVKQGEVFRVILAENPSTGYSWNLAVSNGLKVTGDRYAPPAQQIPGRGGRHEWTIRAMSPGRQEITAVYMRPWEPPQGDETTFALNLNVR